MAMQCGVYSVISFCSAVNECHCHGGVHNHTEHVGNIILHMRVYPTIYIINYLKWLYVCVLVLGYTELFCVR
jgi:hypothetical protein